MSKVGRKASKAVAEVVVAPMLAHFKSVSLGFGGQDASGRSIREVMHQLQSPRMINSNPKCKFSVAVLPPSQPPKLTIAFTNDETREYTTHDRHAKDVIKEINEYILESKPPPVKV
jgi:ABC-type cobalt transport system substrate-binding protein